MISYEEFKSRDHFEKHELLAFAYGRLIEDAPEALKARTLIILDWDDTLLTTTRLTSRHSVFGPGGAPNPLDQRAFAL